MKKSRITRLSKILESDISDIFDDSEMDLPQHEGCFLHTANLRSDYHVEIHLPSQELEHETNYEGKRFLSVNEGDSYYNPDLDDSNYNFRNGDYY